jgi:ubiquinol-cytochrome c reductase iron-sulfur subunit
MTAPVTETKSTRRDILRVATAAVGGGAVLGAVGTAVYLVPMLDEMDSESSALPPPGAVDVDLSAIEPGQQVMVFWRTWPIFVVHRTEAAVATLRNPDLLGQLADPDSERLQQPPYAKNRQRSVRPELAVLVGICTHMGCTPQFYPQPNPSEPAANWLGGYYCPCHGSIYDLAGRVFKDVPAPYNLPVPPHRFIGDKIVRIGENPQNVGFDFNAILQI